ncbi:MAG: TPM domain-containing protein [Gilvibacter sp.]|uniref:TPM domain-containing protein n=1 Tax=Nonlabens ulvanivorans TaxID=906888 RepID=UPI003299EE1F
MRKIIIIVGSLGLLYFFLAYGLPYLTSIPFAYQNSYENWAESDNNELNRVYDNSIDIPEPLGVINDYAKVFSEDQKVELTKIADDYNTQTARQIVIVTVDSIEPYKNIQKYAKDLGNLWGVGMAGKDNGLVIVLCNPLKSIGIATGNSTEVILTDEICSNIIEKVMIPEFENGKYYDGIKKGVTEIIKKWG